MFFRSKEDGVNEREILQFVFCRSEEDGINERDITVRVLKVKGGRCQ